MDNFESRQALLGSIDGAFNTLCELFKHDSFISNRDVGNSSTANTSGSSQSSGIEIVTLLSDDESKNNHPVVVVDGIPSQGNRIPTDSLTRDQCQRVQHLFAYFEKIKSCSDRLQLLFQCGTARGKIGSTDDSDLDINDVRREVAQLQNEVIERKRTEQKHLQMICALRNYLMIEINRAEDADGGLKSAEENLVKMTVERNNYKQMAQKMLETGKSGPKSGGTEKGPVVQKSLVINSEMPELYVGTFVRKKFGVHHFFGLIVQFNHPFFKVIYEDSDEEELSFKELSLSFWPSSVPSTKAAQCKRHATQAGLYNAADMICDSADLTGESGNDELTLLRELVNMRNNSDNSNSNSNKDGVTSDGNTSNDGISCSSSDNSSSSSSKSNGASGGASKKKRVSSGEGVSERACLMSTRNNGRRSNESDNKKSANRATYEWESTAVLSSSKRICSLGSSIPSHNLIDTNIISKKRALSPQPGNASGTSGGKELIDLSADEIDDKIVEMPDPCPHSPDCPTPLSEHTVEDEPITSEEEIETAIIMPSSVGLASVEV